MGMRLMAIAVSLIAACGDSRIVIDAGVGDSRTDAMGTGEFGDPCTGHEDCIEPFCVEPVGGAGGTCTRVCDDDCPTGWDCRPVQYPEGPVNLCIEASGRLCAPCANDAECPAEICIQQDGAGACSVPCTVPADCPTGFECTPDATGVHPLMYCQPVTESCTCNAELAGATRTCSQSNAVGTCYGTETCDAALGWSSCTATTPGNETCDGVDNDCDFMIDDGV